MRVFLSIICLCGIWASAILPVSARGEELRLLTEENPPLNFTKDGQATGLAVDIVDAIQKRLHQTVPVKFYPWVRSYQFALDGPMVGLFSTIRTEQREALFKWVGPISTVKTSLYGKRGDTVSIASLDQAKTLKQIGVPADYDTDQMLTKAGFTNLIEVKTPQELINRLIAGTLPYITATQFQMLRDGAPIAEAKPLYTIKTAAHYVAFSKDTPDSVIAAWQGALDQMKTDGEFAKLYAKWLPGETPPGVK